MNYEGVTDLADGLKELNLQRTEMQLSDLQQLATLLRRVSAGVERLIQVQRWASPAGSEVEKW